jgi:hypothetical protein
MSVSHLGGGQGMTAWLIGAIVFAGAFGGALLGMRLRGILPQTDLGEDSKDAVKLGMGLVATMAALVLGLLVATAKGSYDEQKSSLNEIAANLILLDSAMALYGPEALPVRYRLRSIVAEGLKKIWPADGSGESRLAPDSTEEGEGFQSLLLRLSPANDQQRELLTMARQLSIEMGKDRWRLVAQGEGAAIPVTFIVILVFWLAVLFVSFGLYAPRNLTVIGTMFFSALSVSGAMFLIIELAHPFEGLVQISDLPLRTALSHLAQ